MTKILRHMTIFVGLLLLGGSLALGAPDPVEDCPEGLICFTLQEFIGIREAEIGLAKEYELLKVRQIRRIGWNVGCGGGMTLTVDSDDPPAAVGCFVTWGWRFR